MDGSSPLTRGKLRGRSRIHRSIGLIPAHAGKTRKLRTTTPPGAAHPRSRGENFVRIVTAPVSTGSSPLTRGKPRERKRQCTKSRLIPAHAGKTPARAKGQRLRAAHPRSRGENRFHDRGRGHGYGSSPLTRGKPGRDARGMDQGRLIPAHAGKTFYHDSFLSPPVAHPRSRGENVALLPPDMPIGGSSPLTRGKQGISSQLARPHRLIPAHAGKTPARRRQGPAGPAHPRSRGENIRDPPGPAPPVGSSPLTRGKPVVIQETASDVGLIPAHAGKTQASLTA